MKLDNEPIYPDIADSVMAKVRIPFFSREERGHYARPHKFSIYVPEDSKKDDEESDEETKYKSRLALLKSQYQNKRVEKVTDRKIDYKRGEITYSVLWRDGTVSENVPAEALDDHIDNELVRHYIYQKDIQKAQRGSIY